MLCGIRQLLFNPFHNLSEGRSVEWVSIPAGPHNMIPAQQQKHKHFYLPAVITSPRSFFVCIFFVILVNSQMQQDESRLLCKSHTLHFFLYSYHLYPPFHTISPMLFLHTLINFFKTTHISLGANSGASILFPSFISL